MVVIYFVQRKLLAADMVAMHFVESASEPVNIDGVIRQTVIHGVTSGSSDVFDAAQKQAGYQY